MNINMERERDTDIEMDTGMNFGTGIGIISSMKANIQNSDDRGWGACRSLAAAGVCPRRGSSNA